MKLPERMAVLETEFKNLKKVVWFLVIVVLEQMGVQAI